MIFARIRKVLSTATGKPARNSGAAQFALFAMLVQALIPASSALALPGADAQTRQGQSIPGFYLVICTAHGASAQGTQDQPQDGGRSLVTPWECPVCQAQASAIGPAPVTPEVAFAPYPLPLGSPAPRESDLVAELWNAAPGHARAPPAA